MGLLTIVIQWDEYFIQNISPKISKIAKSIPIVLGYAKIKLRKFVTNSEKYLYDILDGMMFVIGIHERRDGKHPKQSTVER